MNLKPAVGTVRSPSMHLLTDKAAVEKARQTLRDWNFDPDHVTESTCKWYYSTKLHEQHPDCIPYSERLSTPMVIMAHMNDVPTMHYILQQATLNEGKTALEVLAETDRCGLFPLYTAISEPHHEESVLKTVQWLVQQGADVQQSVHGMFTSFRRAAFKGFSKVAQWLVIEGGVFLKNGSDDEFCHTAAKRLMQPVRISYDTAGCTWISAAHADCIHQQLFKWAETTLETRSDYRWVMLGSKRPSSSSLQILDGHPGLLEHIAGFVGVERRKGILATARGLLEHKEWYQLAEKTSPEKALSERMS